ncbi:TonB-dependent receptor [Vibrio vulnificus]|nr:TonB-dependent receptor [Vibrio vulnificus]EHU4866497.1 TonB-dependent receptor [Vibrio vulnificus]EHV9033645.1 TonB-dependent receptor [Vibrio vulnificus]EHV9586027.1 TonB-dependent receptor [Vibrio vulnificus]EHZ2551313.1 TonB-dependent receptor [Vibrio vulnificus]
MAIGFGVVTSSTHKLEATVTMKQSGMIYGLALVSPFCFAVNDTVIIQGHGDESIDKVVLQEQLSQIPGGTNLIDTNALAGSQSSLAKVLNQQAGIIVQEFFGGNDQPRINIRGSGLQDNPVNRGIQLLYDGLALNQADGSFVIGLIDPEQANLISVYRGANGLRYGATTLGGAINFHSKNGQNQGNRVQLEGGSFGAFKAGATLANQTQNWDSLVSIAHSQREGYRPNSAAKRESVNVNVGYQRETWHNRTYFAYVDNHFEIPFLLPKDRALADPQQVMGQGNQPMDTLLNIPRRKPFRTTEQQRLANQTVWQGEQHETQLGFYYEHLDDHFRNPLTQANTVQKNLGFDVSSTLDWSSNDYLSRELLMFAQFNRGNMPREFASVHPVSGDLLSPFASLDLQAQNLTIGGQLRYELWSGFSTIAAVQWVHNQRTITDLMSEGILDSDFDYQVFNPKLGVVYQWDSNKRVFANLSGSSEAPNFWQLATVSANPTDPLNNHVYINDLQLQTATTLEIGGSWQQQTLQWDLAWYYSWVQDELISVVGDFAVNGKTINYQGETIHHGIEAALVHHSDSLLFEGDALASRLIYNWSHFYFADGLYQGNQIAGIPVHLIQGEWDYRPSQQWRITPNFTWQPSETYTDHANSQANRQDPYFLLGLKLGYEPNRDLSLFLEINNLTNTDYQTAYAIRGLGAPDLPTFIPGPGINAMIGASYTW